MLEKLVCTAMDLLCKREISDEEAAAMLTAGNGITNEQAGALVSFVPLAFCRVWLAESGAAFAQTYRVSRGQEGEALERSLSDNAVFVEGARQARQRIDLGMSRDALLAIVMRSAEFRAINKALQNGAQLKDLEVAPPVVSFDVDSKAGKYAP